MVIEAALDEAALEVATALDEATEEAALEEPEEELPEPPTVKSMQDS